MAMMKSRSIDIREKQNLSRKAAIESFGLLLA